MIQPDPIGRTSERMRRQEWPQQLERVPSTRDQNEDAGEAMSTSAAALGRVGFGGCVVTGHDPRWA